MRQCRKATDRIGCEAQGGGQFVEQARCAEQDEDIGVNQQQAVGHDKSLSVRLGGFRRTQGQLLDKVGF